MPTTTTPGLVPTRFAPTPEFVKPRARAATPSVSGRLPTIVSADSEFPGLRFRFERPSPPALVGPRPARPAVRTPAGVPPIGVRAQAGASSQTDLTLLVWASFFTAAVIAGTVGVVHRIRRRLGATTVFGRPLHEIDEWLAGAELAATRTPPPVEPGSGEGMTDPDPQADDGPPAAPDPAGPG